MPAWLVISAPDPALLPVMKGAGVELDNDQRVDLR